MWSGHRDLHLASVEAHRPDPQTLLRILQTTAVLKAEMLFVEWRGNHQIALDTADQPATDDIRPGLRVMIIDLSLIHI